MVLQNGFLLSFLKYGENDAILHCFTEDDGFQTYFLRGIYTQKNKKRAFLLPLNHLSLSVRKTKNGNIQSVSRFETLEISDFYSDVKANTIVFFTADFLNQILKNENKNSTIYESLVEFSSELNKKNYRSHLIFLIKILIINGVAPLSGNGSYLDPETGTFTASETHLFFTENISAVWKEIIASPQPYKTKIPSKIRKAFLDSVIIYYHYHIPDFRTPISLEVIHQIFE